MPEKYPTESFAPIFLPDEYTEEQQKNLAPFFTNLDKSVYVPLILAPELIGALCSRTSRAAEDLRLIYLREFVNPFINPVREEKDTDLLWEEKVSYGKNLKDIILVAVLGIVASYSTVYKRTIRVPSAVELVTLGTVITGVAYGPVVGALFGIITTFASEIISSGIDVFTLFYATSRGLSGALSQFLVVTFSLNIVLMGMIALVIFHAISDAIYILSGDVEAKLKVVYFLVVNTLFNFLMFSLFGSLLLGFARL